MWWMEYGANFWKVSYFESISLKSALKWAITWLPTWKQLCVTEKPEKCPIVTNLAIFHQTIELSHISVTELLSSMLLTLNYTSSSSSYKISHSNVHNFSIFWIISTQSLLDGMFQIFVLSVPPCINTRTKQDMWLFFCHMLKTLQALMWTTITITYIMVF